MSTNPVTVPQPGPVPSAPEKPSLSPVQPPRPRMGWGKRAAAIVFVLLVAAVVVASLLPKPVPPTPIQATAARKGEITRLVTAAGKLQAATEVKLSANVSGDLLSLKVQEGDVVKKGQVLGQIDSRRYDEQVRGQAAARESAVADIQLEKVKVAQLQADLARLERLAKTGNASDAEVDTGRANLNAEKARLAAAEQKAAQADASLRESRHSQSLTTLVSPIDGVVTKREKQVGERVRGSELSEDVILVISTLSKMEVKVEVGEHEVTYVKEGDPAEVEIDAFPDRKFAAQVVEVARNATVKKEGTENEVTTFFVRLALTDKQVQALPGMSAQATISTETHQDAVVVPIQAVTVRPEREVKGGAGGPPPGEKPLPQPANGANPGVKARREPLQKVVFVVDNGVAKLRAVETGLASDTEIEITSGLKQGEKVVDGPYRVLSRELSDGNPVTEQAPGGKGGPDAKKG